jgi:hypothetical protein
MSAPDPTSAIKYQWRIKETNLNVLVRARGAAEMQAFVKPNRDGTMRVQWRNKRTCQQWTMTVEACDTMMAALPEKLTMEVLAAAIAAVPAVRNLMHPQTRVVQLPPRKVAAGAIPAPATATPPTAGRA